jgi:hypothetical protein
MTDDVIAQTPQGRLRGVRDGQALRFLGIPYVAAQMAGHLGVSMLSRAVLEELPAETILAAQEVVMATGTGAVGGQKDGGAVMDLLSGGIRLPWAPWTDGEVVTEDPVQAAASPRHSLAFHCLDVPFVSTRSVNRG